MRSHARTRSTSPSRRAPTSISRSLRPTAPPSASTSANGAMPRSRQRVPSSSDGDMVAPMRPTDESSTPAISPDAVLVRAREVRVRLTDEDEIGLDVGGDQLHAPRVALALLDAFSTPRRVGEVLASITGGDERRLEAEACVASMVRNGVLVVPEERAALGTRGWVRP